MQDREKNKLTQATSEEYAERDGKSIVEVGIIVDSFWVDGVDDSTVA